MATRRSRRLPSFGLAVLSLAWAVSAAADVLDASSRPHRRPVAVQLHIHQSMSEGPGSFRGHVRNARDGGVTDVIWFTDYDWRMAFHGHVSGFSFDTGLGPEAVEIPARIVAAGPDVESVPVRWVVEDDTLGATDEAGAAGAASASSASSEDRFIAEAVREPSCEGKGALALALRSAPGAGHAETVRLRLKADAHREMRSLAAGIRVRLAVYPRAPTSDHSRLAVRFTLSQQPPEGQAALVYWLADALPEGVAARDGVVRHQAVPVVPGRWNELVFELTEDAVAGDIGGLDNALTRMELELHARSGGEVRVVVDDLRIEHDISGDALMRRAREIASALETEKLTLHVGQEISFGVHVNAFGPDVPLPDYAAHPRGLDGREAVDFVHRHGGVALLDHPFGVNRGVWKNETESFRDRVAHMFVERLVRERCYGADALEVGYRLRGGMPLGRHLDLWDRLGDAGIVITGVGSSDTHDNERVWKAGHPNNWLTWVWSRSSGQTDLMDGLRSGAAYFGDPELWDGRMDLSTEDGLRMGDVAVGRTGPQQVTFTADPVPVDWKAQIVVDGTTVDETGGTGGAWRRTLTIDAGRDDVARFCLHNGDEPVACSNPIYFLDALDVEHTPSGRRVVRSESGAGQGAR